MRRFTLPLVLVAMLPFRAAAQSEPIATPTEPPPPKMSLAFGVHYGSPMRTSAALGVLVDMSVHRNDGVIAMIEPGYAGSEISAGYFRMIGRLGSGYSLRAAAVRTGDEPWNASPHTTYIGVEAHWMLIFGIGGRLGYLRRASRSVNDPHENLASVGISIGM